MAVGPTNEMNCATPRASDAWRGRWVVALALGAGLVQACGGLAQDVADETDERAALGLDPTASRGRDADSRGRSNGSSASGRATPTPRQAEPGPGEEEVCYSPTRLAETAGIGNLLQFLPDDALDDNGCLTSEYSSWLNGGNCQFAPRPAVVRGDQCCHLLDAGSSSCGRR
ncbi:MAG TPA: hypothetical protein VMG12_20700 [Polyangiaceae bacterium]|nr:hypothetical protein [Polyangiaceae bacterium]